MSKQSKITSFFNNGNLPSTKRTANSKYQETLETIALISDDEEKKEEMIVTPDIMGIDAENDFLSQPDWSSDCATDFIFDDVKKKKETMVTSDVINIDIENDIPSQPDRSSDYVADFLSDAVKDFLSSTSSHYLFTEKEIQTLCQFSELSSVHKKLLSRMYWLTRKWNRISDMISKYSSSIDIVKELIEKGFLESSDEKMTFDDWIRISSKIDLVKVCKHFKLQTNFGKKSLSESLKKFCSSKFSIFDKTSANSMERTVVKMMAREIGECIRVEQDSKSLFDRLHLLTYLSVNPAIIRENRLNLMLLNIKNGLQFFPTTNIEIDSPVCVFPSKRCFDDYFYAHGLYEQIAKLTLNPPYDHETVISLSRQCLAHYKKSKENKGNVDGHSINWLRRFSSDYTCIKTLEISITSYKAMNTDDYLDEALTLLTLMLEQKEYRQHKRALWYNEKVLILQTRFRQFEKAAEVLKIGLKETDISDDAKAPLKDRAFRLAKQKNTNLCISIRRDLLKLCEESKVDLPFVEISAKSVDDFSSVPGRKARYLFQDVLSGDRIYSSVEDYALLHYLNDLQFSSGEHWEGRIVRSMFVLLFWDIIYCNMEKGLGIFLSRYQDAPLDLYTSAFYENRKDQIEKRLHDIEEKWDDINYIIDFMKKIYFERNEGEVSLFDNNIEWEKIFEITNCLGRQAIACLCKRLAKNYHYTSAGFPDLTVWNYSLKKIKFVEVKGDGDRLSNKQIQWMEYMLQNGIETEVCYVHKGVTKKKSPKKLSSVIAELDMEENTIPKKKRRNVSKVNNNLPEDNRVPKKKSRIASKVKTSNNEKPDDSSSSPSVKNTKSNIRNRRKDSEGTPSKSASPKKSTSASQQISDCYLRSPTKFSKGVGYFVSPIKSSQESGSSQKSNSNSPRKFRSRLSLSLTKKRLFEKDT